MVRLNIPNASRSGRNKKYNCGSNLKIKYWAMGLHRVVASLALRITDRGGTDMVHQLGNPMTEKERKREYHKEWYKRNKNQEKLKAKNVRVIAPDYNASWLKENGHKPKVRFDKAKSNTTTKYHKEWHLSFEEYELIISAPCNYCKCDISKDKGSGLDRLNNSEGYKVGNVVPCCKACNVGRNTNFTPEEWQVGIEAILKFRKNGIVV